jgi:excisionase family DNA binding protein
MLDTTACDVLARVSPATEGLGVTGMSANVTDGRTVGAEPRPAVSAELLNVKAVAALLGCSVRHCYRLSDAGRMPRPVKLGALVRWRRAELVEWLNAGCPPVRSARGAVR